MKREITDAQALEELVSELGFLPFFANEIAGFSVEEHTPTALWFSDTADGPWEWKGPVADRKACVYGKLFSNKAGFVSLEWFPDLANYRRDGSDFDAQYEEGFVGRKEKQLYDTIVAHGALSTRRLRSYCDYRKGGQKGFDTVIARLQMQTYVHVADFEYMVDRHGRPYGWGMACYSTPEAQFGEALVTSAYHRSPTESKARILAHLAKRLPMATAAQIEKLIRG